MERTYNDVVEGETFSCTKCKNTVFVQTCYVQTHEAVTIKKNDKEIKIISNNMFDVREEDIEYNNEFVCPKCETKYTIGKKDGVDIIYDMGEEYDE